VIDCTGIPTLVKRVNKSFTVTTTGTPTYLGSRTINKIFLATCTGTPSIIITFVLYVIPGANSWMPLTTRPRSDRVRRRPN
jgi:hypothetical protein